MANLYITTAKQFQFASMEDLIAYQRGDISYAECEMRYWQSVAIRGEHPEAAVCTQTDHRQGTVTFDTIQ